MDLSPIGEAVLIAREGRRLKAYRDVVGVWTIGVGHTSAAGPPVVKAGLTISAAECDALFARDVERYVAAVRQGLRVPVSQNAFDALVSVCYNIGPAAFAKSSFLRAINAGDMAAGRAAILLWQKPASIIARRQAEADQFMTPYALALPAPRRGESPIRVAAPVIAVVHPEVATPVITPVVPTPSTRQRFGNWLAGWLMKPLFG